MSRRWKKDYAGLPENCRDLRPIFVGGAGRCGATTLASCIEQVPCVSRFRRECRFFVDSGGILDLAEDLTTQWDPFRGSRAVLRWLSLIAWLKEHPRGKARVAFQSWEALMPAALELARRVSNRMSDGSDAHLFADVPEQTIDSMRVHLKWFVAAVYSSLNHEATSFVEDTSYSVLAADRLRKWFPDSFLVWVIRDPFEVALAHYGTRWGEDTLEANARKLRGVLLRAQALQPFISATVRFETLVKEPRKALDPLQDILGEKINEVPPFGTERPRWWDLSTKDKEILCRELGAVRKGLGY